MFDSTKVHVDGSHFNYNINAVSGTIRKSHPKSQMIIRELEQNGREFNVANPTVWVNRGEEEIIVLQVMLIGDNKAIIEFVRKEHFEEGWNG